MELWVRHANKKKLIKVNCVGYEEYNNSLGERYFYIYSDNACNLGEYKTEERCIEIIDEIQKLLLSADPKEAFMIVDCRNENEFAYISHMVDFARERNFIAFDGSDGASVQLVQPSVLVYEMPKE